MTRCEWTSCDLHARLTVEDRRRLTTAIAAAEEHFPQDRDSRFHTRRLFQEWVVCHWLRVEGDRLR